MRERVARVLLPLMPALVLAAPAAVAALGGFDGLYGQDSFAYHNYAAGPLREYLREPWNRGLPPFYWPPGYPLLVALLVSVLGNVTLAGQALSLFMAGMAAVCTGLLARELQHQVDGATPERNNPRVERPRSILRIEASGESVQSLQPSARLPHFVPLAAGLLVACTGQLWQSAVVVMADTTGLAAAVLGAWALARYARRGGGRWLVVAGVGFATAVLARWIYVLVLLPAGAYALVALRRQAAAGWRRAAVHGLGACMAGGLLVAPMVLPVSHSRLGLRPASESFAGNFNAYRWSALNALRREFNTSDGHLSYDLPNGLYYALAPAHRYAFTPLLAAFVLPGAWALLKRQPTGLLLIGGWAAAVYAFHAGAAWQNFRFTLAYVPPLAVLSAMGLRAAFVDWPRVPRPRWAVGVLAVGLLAMAAGGAQLTHSFVARKQADLEAVRAVEQHLPPGARLFAFGLTSTLRHYSNVETLELYDFAPADLPAALAGPGETYLLVDVAGLETQWRDARLGHSYAYLRDEAGLTLVERLGAYSLFRVGGD
jgi:hypothetical protein